MRFLFFAVVMVVALIIFLVLYKPGSSPTPPAPKPPVPSRFFF